MTFDEIIMGLEHFVAGLKRDRAFLIEKIIKENTITSTDPVTGEIKKTPLSGEEAEKRAGGTGVMMMHVHYQKVAISVHEIHPLI